MFQRTTTGFCAETRSMPTLTCDVVEHLWINLWKLVLHNLHVCRHDTRPALGSMWCACANMRQRRILCQLGCINHISSVKRCIFDQSKITIFNGDNRFHMIRFISSVEAARLCPNWCFLAIGLNRPHLKVQFYKETMLKYILEVLAWWYRLEQSVCMYW